MLKMVAIIAQKKITQHRSQIIKVCYTVNNTFYSCLQVTLVDTGITIPKQQWIDIHSRKRHSIFLREMALLVWDRDVLANHIINGKAGNCRKSGDVARPTLTPVKYRVLKRR